MSTTLGELAAQVRSKNAGPFWITIDVFFATANDYDRGAHSQLVDPQVLGPLYAAPPEQIKVFRLPDLNAIKVSLPRPTAQGSCQDRDMHAGQQYVPLLGLAVT
jgi:Domain of unknown function (DUF4387)